MLKMPVFIDPQPDAFFGLQDRRACDELAITALGASIIVFVRGDFEMPETLAKPELVAYCGLYCGACRSYTKGKCAGCHENAKASWCTVRSCCIENGFSSCADCRAHSDPNGCMKFNNFMSRLFGFVFKSDRAACIEQIRQSGISGHAEIMAGKNIHTIKRQTR